MILGNHDIYIRNKYNKIVGTRPNSFIDDINKCNNIYLLEDETYTKDNITFYGFRYINGNY